MYQNSEMSDRRHSAAALERIDRLKRNEDFLWFLDQVRERMVGRRNEALYSSDELLCMRAKHAFLALESDAVNLMDALEEGHRSVLGDEGVLAEDAI